MAFTVLAGLGGLGFVLLAVVVNVCYLRARLPMPGANPDGVAHGFAAAGDALKRPSVLAPASWLCTTAFAAGLLSVLPGAWALAGFAGVLLQNATFAVVEALRFGMAAAARDGGSPAGWWGFSAVLFGFNQVFLATALLGFSVAGAQAGFFAGWHVWLGYASAALLFVSASAAPYHVDGTNRLASVGLVGWLGWAAWVVAGGVTLLAY
ncbi:hypothetical protein Q5425_07665 [Amycolatopsis sp. A133]|uniref:hypothetical protein n=1 Tax=Amycolatopsis sp. A133 TaxID=3064472 RepID=UPI0027EE8693|nr:hypothetical protein [Amycolatopsis sp. A133]MDQ7803603.1 hypothetical protein [Amycolatopsis sp. A133]